MKVKKREEIESRKKLKREEKKNKKLAEITKKRLKIDPTYVEEKSENSVQEVNKIFTSITEVNCALDRLLEKYIFTDFKSLNHLKMEEEINSHTEMLDTARNVVKKIEKINQYVSHVGKGVNSDIINYPAQSINSPSDSQNKAVEIILGV